MSSDKDPNTPISPNMDAGGHKEGDISKPPDAEKDGDNLKEIDEANTLESNAYEKDTHDEYIKNRQWKRRAGISAVVIAGIVPLCMLVVAYLALFGYLQPFDGYAKVFDGYSNGFLLKIILISTSVLSFIVIYGIIIRSTLTSSQQNMDVSNLARGLLESLQKKFGSE